MEAMWTYFQPAVLRMKEIIANGSIGDVVNTNIVFGFPVAGRPGFSILDLAVYPVYLAQV